jgi:hypothetical protein
MHSCITPSTHENQKYMKQTDRASKNRRRLDTERTQTRGIVLDVGNTERREQKGYQYYSASLYGSKADGSSVYHAEGC